MSPNFTPISRARRAGPEAEPITVTPGTPAEMGHPPVSETEPSHTEKNSNPAVTVHPDVVALTNEIRAAGVESVGGSTAGPTLDLDDTQIYEALDESIDNPLRWLGEQGKKALLKAGFYLKKIHGHVTRVPAEQPS
jgi:hypothetical protein